jgi:hypothetical protein
MRDLLKVIREEMPRSVKGMVVMTVATRKYAMHVGQID